VTRELQTLLTAGIPTIAVIVSILHFAWRLKRFRKRLDSNIAAAQK
jgi:hypothetical protein